MRTDRYKNTRSSETIAPSKVRPATKGRIVKDPNAPHGYRFVDTTDDK
jgi:hypothetical protein